MLRRDFMSTVVSGVALAGCVSASRSANSSGPLFWLATKNRSRVFLLGFGDARDQSWFTPIIERAFVESSELWLENAEYAAPDQNDASARQKTAELEKLGHESGRTFFDALDPRVRERTLAYMSETGIKRESIETLRPWRAYYILNSAFWSKRRLAYQPVHVDAVLRKLAVAAHKKIGYEMPTGESFVRFMASMSDKAQSQYIEWLLDYIEDDNKGLNDEDGSFSWTTGKPGESAVRSLERMRTNMPDLYRVMQPKRNEWWAQKIIGLLAAGDTSFVAVGQLHVMGPDGIPRQLERLGVRLQLLR